MPESTPKTWLITGADKGLGLSTAEAALERGDRVVVTVLAKDGSHPLTERYPEHFRAFHLDAMDQDRIPTVIKKAEDAFSGIDILVNNAGYGLLAVAEDTSAAQYRPLFEVHFFAMAETTRAILPGMRHRRSGHIINLSSVAGFAGNPGFSFYCAAKFAVEGYSEALSKEVKHLGIKVTILEPGGFRSDFAGSSLASAVSTIPDYEEVANYIATYSAERHGAQPNDPVLFGPTLCQLVDEEQPPLRLPMGTDAVDFVRNEINAVVQELDRWEELSAKTTRPPVSSEAVG